MTNNKINSDLKITGRADTFRVLYQLSSDSMGWVETGKVMEIYGLGCALRVLTTQRYTDGTVTTIETMTFIPGAKISEDSKGNCRIVKIEQFSEENSNVR